MGGVVKEIGRNVNQWRNDWHSGMEYLNNATGTRIGDVGNAFGEYVGGAIGGPISQMGTKEEGPAPEIDAGLTEVQKAQAKTAREFRANAGKTKSLMQQDLSQTNNQNMLGEQRQVDTKNNARGLLYGGMNAGEKAGVRSKHQGLLAGGISSINTGIDQAADELDAQVMETEVGVQKSKQQIQDAVYQKALANMNADNALMGNVVGGIMTVAAL